MRANMMRLDTNKVYLVTGAAGFIGFHLSKRLLGLGCTVIGLDNLNDYYEVSLKEERLRMLASEQFIFYKVDLADRIELDAIFVRHQVTHVINLAAQAGVRYSIDNPYAYLQSNLVGFLNILECCRHHAVEHLVYASSSSVYGLNSKIPYSTQDKVDNPVSLYAATKKSNELMAHAYTHLYHIPTTGLRFFTVYGPYGRPDMAYFSFSKRIMEGKSIKVFNNGDMWRDFTYVDDIITALENIIPNIPEENEAKDQYKVYNIGNNKPVRLKQFIETLEQCLGKNAEKEYLPMQPGDVYQTYADVTDLMEDFDFRPNTPLEQGLEAFVSWFKPYYGY
ncbi:SDR family NAD(P)-dependent oxidoreductase [uncultured Sphaerochaeta sp.]|uniref:SDR family NAD(P)-dependent oxidoreductase n=1 Tax=uncultured Sphaerochaeta sp. TaxID=886478 RepID=UPI0029C9D1B3|nr:SDR family NAD(P)-dependent oxidoreductase [uncultured Sphaerochaeta sp.]